MCFPQTLLWLSISYSEVTKGLTMAPRALTHLPFPHYLSDLIYYPFLILLQPHFLAVPQIRPAAKYFATWGPFHVLYPLPATPFPQHSPCPLPYFFLVCLNAIFSLKVSLTSCQKTLYPNLTNPFPLILVSFFSIALIAIRHLLSFIFIFCLLHYDVSSWRAWDSSVLLNPSA